jgi:hypothetical protein
LEHRGFKHRGTATLLLAAAAVTGAIDAQSSNPNRAPTAAEQTEALAGIRAYALNYTRTLPDYTCAQVINWTGVVSLVRPRRVATSSGVTETQIGYVDHTEMERLMTVDGKPPVEADRRDLPPAVSHGEFGTLLARIFDPQIPVEFGWAHWGTINGRRMYVFSYRVPQANGYIVRDAHGSATVAFKGLIYADAETKAIMRIELECVGFPATSEYRSLELKLNYKLTRVADREFVLPSEFEETCLRSSDKGQENTRFKAQFERYQRFTADAQLQFGEADSGEQK